MPEADQRDALQDRGPARTGLQRLGGDPDLVTLAKSLTGGLPAGAVGMTAEFEHLLAKRDVRLMGTYNGNPLSMVAASASLRQVLTPGAYDELERLGAHVERGVFGADMRVSSVNDGPVTLILDSRDRR